MLRWLKRLFKRTPREFDITPAVLGRKLKIRLEKEERQGLGEQMKRIIARDRVNERRGTPPAEPLLPPGWAYLQRARMATA